MARKKDKRLTIAIVAILVIVLFILNYQGVFKPFAIGSSTLSLSNVDLRSSNPYLNGKAWLLTFVSGGLGQSYTGTFTPSQVDSFTSDSSKTTKSFTIDVDYSPTVCSYDINYQSGALTSIYDVELRTYQCLFEFLSPSPEEVKLKTGLRSLLFLGKNYPTCWGIGWNTESPVANIQNPNIQSEYDITLSVEGGPLITKSIDTLSSSKQGQLGDFAYAIWNGNLGSGISCPSQSPYKSAYQNGVWTVIGDADYQGYVAAYNNFRTNLPALSSQGASLTEIQNQVNSLRNRIILAQAKKSFISSSYGLINAQQLANAKITLQTSTQIIFPMTSLYIKSDTIGIFTPVPEIKILSTSSECFKTGSTGTISAVIKNEGQERGTFRAFTECSSPFSQSYPIEGTLEAGESRTLNLPLTASASQKITGSCNVIIESTGPRVTRQVNTCVDPQITCTVPYPEKFCAIQGTQEVVKQCSVDGATSQITDTCLANEFCEQGECKLEGDGGGDYTLGFWDRIKKFFDGLFGGVFDALKIIKYTLVFIGGFSSIFISKGFYERFKPLRKKGILWTLSIATGLGSAGFLLAFIGGVWFWVSLTSLLISGIILSFIPGARLLKRWLN